MSQGTAIEYATDSLNPWTGCQRVSPACDHCFAATMARRFCLSPEVAAWKGDLLSEPREKVTKHIQALTRARAARRIFCGTMTDLGLVAQRCPGDLAAFLTDLLRMQMARALAGRPLHTILWLTKRPAPLGAFFTMLRYDRPSNALRFARGGGNRLDLGDPIPASVRIPGLWVGVTIEDQERAQQRLPVLATIPNCRRFISAEPIMGPVDLDAPVHHHRPVEPGSARIGQCVEWVITGGETGHGSRPSHPGWFHGLHTWASKHAVPFFFKSWGDWADHTSSPPAVGHEDIILAPTGEWLGAGDGKRFGMVEHNWRERGGAWMCRVGKKGAGCLLDGREHMAVPEGPSEIDSFFLPF